MKAKSHHVAFLEGKEGEVGERIVSRGDGQLHRDGVVGGAPLLQVHDLCSGMDLLLHLLAERRRLPARSLSTKSIRLAAWKTAYFMPYKHSYQAG